MWGQSFIFILLAANVFSAEEERHVVFKRDDPHEPHHASPADNTKEINRFMSLFIVKKVKKTNMANKCINFTSFIVYMKQQVEGLSLPVDT